MTPEDLKDRLQEPGQSFRLGSVIQEVAGEARRDPAVMDSLETLLEDCRNPDFWKSEGRWGSTLFHSIVRVGNSRSMMLLLNFARSLPEDFPFGPIDLLGNILPLYGHIMIGPAKELIQSSASSACHAVGVQTLCQLYLDGAIRGDNERYLEKMIGEFDGDTYLSQNIIDLVRNSMVRAGPAESGTIDPDDVLVQIGD